MIKNLLAVNFSKKLSQAVRNLVEYNILEKRDKNFFGKTGLKIIFENFGLILRSQQLTLYLTS